MSHLNLILQTKQVDIKLSSMRTFSLNKERYNIFIKWWFQYWKRKWKIPSKQHKHHSIGNNTRVLQNWPDNLAWVIKLLKKWLNWKRGHSNKGFNYLEFQCIQDSWALLLYLAQHELYIKEILSLSNKQIVDKNSTILYRWHDS